MKNLYEDLGVASGATKDAIKKAYRRKAQKSHPDKGGNQEEFQMVKHAYEILSDDARRARYDECGDESAPQEMESQAMTSIAALVMQCIDKSDVKYEDIIAKVRRMIDGNITEMKKTKIQITARITKLEGFSKRLKTSADENKIAAFALHESQQMKGMLQNADDQISVLNEMLDILKSYEYRVDSGGSQSAFSSPVFSFLTNNF